MKTIIFDFDGTIADSFEVLLSIFDEVAKRPKNLSTIEVTELRGKSLNEIIKYLKVRRWQIPRMILKAKKLLAVKVTSIAAFENMPKTLQKLNETGYQMFILSTNSSDNISKFLKKNGLEIYFTKIYGDIGLRSKSSALKKIIKIEKLAAKDCYYIGDEVRDIEAATKVGVVSVAVTWGFNSPKAMKNARPSAIANKPQDLIKLLSD
jgi:phosphoglycolate phosphatase